MKKTGLLTAVDVGTTKVCTIIAMMRDSNLELLGHSTVPCNGVTKGNVEDQQSTTEAIRKSITGAERDSGVSVQSVYVGVTGTHVGFQNRSDTLKWIGNHGVVTAEEIEKIPEAVASSTATDNREVIHSLPMSYRVDNATEITNPIGMHSNQIEVKTHVVTGDTSFISKLIEAVKKTGVTLESLVLEPLASGLAVLTPEERKTGVALVDIGGGTTDLAVFNQGRACYTSVIPVGGYQFTNDICHVYNTPYAAAENAKLKYAHTMLHMVRPHEEVSLPMFDGSSEISIPRRDICQLMRERAQELLHLIKVKLQEAPIEDTSKVKVVITGGTSNLPGLLELAQQNLMNRVRVGVPKNLVGVPNNLRSPAYATAVGILLWAINQSKQTSNPTNNNSEVKSKLSQDGFVRQFFKRVSNPL